MKKSQWQSALELPKPILCGEAKPNRLLGFREILCDHHFHTFVEFGHYSELIAPLGTS